MVANFLHDFLVAVVFPLNIGPACGLAILATIPKSITARWAIISGGALGIAIIWLALFQDPNSSSTSFILAFIATMLAAFLEGGFVTCFLRHKVGWDTPFHNARS
jgi:hypothetical protein